MQKTANSLLKQYNIFCDKGWLIKKKNIYFVRPQVRQ